MLYKPFRPDQRFCTSKCRLDFHHHGGAYVKLKPLVIKLTEHMRMDLERKLRLLISDTLTQELNKRGIR